MGATIGQKVVAILALLVFIIVVVLNAISATRSDSAIFIKLFNNRTNVDISNEFYVNITPAGYAFSIWGLIYTWQAAWLIYSIVTAFRKDGPVVLSYSFFVSFILGCIFNVLWLIVFSHENVSGSLAVIASDWVFLVITLVMAYIDVENNQPTLQKQHPKDLICLRVLVQNGISIITSWVTVATCLNLSIVFVYLADLSQTTGCSIALSVLTILAIIYYIFENFIYADELRYTFVPWLVIIWALVAILVKNFDLEKPEAIFSAVLLGVIGLLLIIRIILVIVRKPGQGSYFNGMQLI